MRRSLIFWFLVPLLLAGCVSEEDEGFETVSFTAEDAAEISALLDGIEASQSSSLPASAPMISLQGGEPASVTLDVSQTHRFAALRSGISETTENALRVTNAFLNVRASPSVRGEKVEELRRGDRLTLLSFPNAGWAEVQLSDGRKGYVNTSYVAQLATEEALPELKKKYEGLYSVNFAFLNVRSNPESRAQKLGELTSGQIVKPAAFVGEWARIPFTGPTSAPGGATASTQEGFVSAQYLKPFVPKFLVREEDFSLPILRYRGDEAGVGESLVKHLAVLKSAGRNFLTLREFYELLLAQEERDVRLPTGSVLLAVSDVTPASLRDIADALRATGVQATFFLETGKINPQGISPDLVRSLSSAGHDVQSAGHSGGDLRALTNTQVALDLQQSKQILEDLTGKNVLAIAYPGGGVNDRIVEQAIERGYLFGATLATGSTFSRSEFLRLPSNLISPGTPEQTLKMLVGILP